MMMMQKLFHYVVLTLIRTTASSIPFISRICYIWNALSETTVEASTENVLKQSKDV